MNQTLTLRTSTKGLEGKCCPHKYQVNVTSPRKFNLLFAQTKIAKFEITFFSYLGIACKYNLIVLELFASGI